MPATSFTAADACVSRMRSPKAFFTAEVATTPRSRDIGAARNTRW